jgi:hypothetical protein
LCEGFFVAQLLTGASRGRVAGLAAFAYPHEKVIRRLKNSHKADNEESSMIWHDDFAFRGY